MRLLRLFAGDIRFQAVYGFWFLYGILTLLYLLLLSVLPGEWREAAAAMLIFSDPAAMGLFFMGACILLEKSQRVLQVIAVSPVTVREYMLSKAASFAGISRVVAAVLAIGAGYGPGRLPLVLAGTLYGSLLFSLLGMAAASGINSINQYLFITVPIEMILFIPLIFFFLGREGILAFFPTVICMKMLLGIPQNGAAVWLAGGTALLLCAWAAWLCLEKMWKRLGGVKL